MKKFRWNPFSKSKQDKKEDVVTLGDYSVKQISKLKSHLITIVLTVILAVIFKLFFN